MKTRETTNELGLYVSECCGEELIFDEGDTFARCPQCHAPCTWELEEDLFSSEQLERQDTAA